MAPWIAVLVLGIALTVSLMRRPAASATRASQIRSLAVLPFAFETQDPKVVGLGKQIPAEIRQKLGPLQNLEVVNSPMRVEQLLQQKKSEVEIARELGVDGLVMGELHDQGESMSAYVSVVDGATGRALGKQREIASSSSKVSELPSQVALAIVDELKLQLSASQRAEIQAADTQNGEAFLAFQKGRDFLSSHQFSQAAVELRRAYQLDTNYTRAWTALAQSEWQPLVFGGTTNEMAATFKRLSAEAERFRARRPEDQAVASLRMWVGLLYERDWNKVRTIFWENQRNPKPDPGVVHAMSWYYSSIEGHPELALNARQQAIAMDPENLFFQIDRAHQLNTFGRYDDGVRAFRSFLPEKIQLEDYSFSLLMAGDLVGAKEVAARVLAGRPNALTQCNLAAIHAKSGAADEARRSLGELEAQAEKGMHIPYAWIASRYGMLGDFEAARRWMRTGLLEGHGDWSMLSLRAADQMEVFGKLAWYWEIVDGMKFPPLLPANPYFALEQAMRYGRGTVGPATTSTNELKIQLGMEETRNLAQKPTANPEAHLLYLLGRYHFGKITEASYTNAIEYFNQALRLDPSYALAYCGLADSYGWLGGNLLSGKEAWAKEKAQAQKALALDPNLADAHLSLGIALVGAFDWNGCEQEIKRALELSPRLALAYNQLGGSKRNSGGSRRASGIRRGPSNWILFP